MFSGQRLSSPTSSKLSDSYPSWLPHRPSPPPPASIMHSESGIPEPGSDTDPELFTNIGGRKPTLRSARIVSLHGISPHRRDTPRLGPPAKAWSRDTAPDMPGAAYPCHTSIRVPQPKFNAKSLDLTKHVASPSILARFYFFIFPVLAFVHLPLQTYLDFNAVYILIQVSKYPNPEAPSVPGSGRNWELAAAAYVACWLAWITCVFLLYELAYSFIRRWRVKCPVMMPIYLSSPAHTFVSLTSYTNFRFLLYLRLQTWFGEYGSIRDGLAEAFYWYSQNLPTVALLLPRAGLCLALLLAFSTSPVDSLSSTIIRNRDPTYFRENQGTLTGYARGVLIANASWAAWRILVLLVSLIGLWVISGQGCAGLCGPRFRWEEEDNEKTRSSTYGTNNNSNRDIDALAWTWKERTRLRIQDTYELCSTNAPGLRWGNSSSPIPGWTKEKGKQVIEHDRIDVPDVLTTVGIPSVPAPARHRALADDFFESPEDDKEIEFRHRESDRGIGPSTQQYPFGRQGSAQVSSQDRVPFPPSPSKSKQTISRSATSQTSSEPTSSSHGSIENDSGDEDEESGGKFDESEERSTGHASNSMSSLGYPISPSRRYLFGFRYPGGRGNSTSSRSHQSRPSQSGVSQFGMSHSGISQSTDNQPSTKSSSDNTSTSSDSGPSASPGQSSGGSSIPMPPRHPNPQIRIRAPSVPLAASAEPPSVRSKVDSGNLPGITLVGTELMQGDAESISSSDSVNGERQDEVRLLDPGASNIDLAISCLAMGSGSASLRTRTGSSTRSRANSSIRSRSSIPAVRSRVSSLGIAVRSQARTMFRSVSATSLGLVAGTRSRANSSMTRLEEEEAIHQLPAMPSTVRTRDVSGSNQESSHSDAHSFSDPRAWEDHNYMTSSHSRSQSGSGGENWTFGQPMSFMLPPTSHLREDVHSDDNDQGGLPGSTEEEIKTRRDDPVREITRDFGSARIHPQALVGPVVPGAIPISTSVASAPIMEDVFHSTRTSGVTLPLQTPKVNVLHQVHTLTENINTEVGSSLGGTGSSLIWPDISTAAQSFVTAPLTTEGTMTTEEGSGEGRRTERRSLDEASWSVTMSRAMRGAGIANVGIGPGGIGPERTDTMGDWRQR